MLVQPVPSLCAVEDPLFAREIGALLGPPLADGNRIETLVNGDAFYPAMLEAIRRAERSVTLETYMMEDGRAADAFVELLGARVAAGVPVHVTLDWFGSRKLSAALSDRMRALGIELAVYRPPSLGRLLTLDRRTHRKILVVDGKIGFTGGMGITDEWLGDAEGPGHWRDTALRVEGPAVAQLQAVFVDNWVECTGRILHGDAYFPALPRAGGVRAQAFGSTPQEGNYSARVMYHLSIASAQRSIRIANAYFVPDRTLVEALVAARSRGVEVEVLVAGPTDVRLTRWASRIKWGALLAAGVRIHEYRRAVLHAKTLLVDECWLSVGSINADALSLRLLDEVAVNVLDRAVGAEHVAIFERDKESAVEITYDGWRRRTFGERVREWIGRMFEPRL